jgi:uncharacterized protein YcbX
MHLSRIEIFPIKSLDGVVVEEARITSGGILEHDRAYAMLDLEGKVVNGKRTARVHQLRCAFDPAIQEIRLWPGGGSPTQFRLDDRDPIGKWLSDFFGFAVTLRQDSEKGFPDDRVAFGPTITSEASLHAVREWYPALALENIRRRFRANLELGGGKAFCEDQLFGSTDELKPFRIGPVLFAGHNPCQRCVVPTRDPESGEAIADFQNQFMRLRKEHLPEWTNAQRFNHFYRFAVNTSIPSSETGKHLRTGDVLSLGCIPSRVRP